MITRRHFSFSSVVTMFAGLIGLRQPLRDGQLGNSEVLGKPSAEEPRLPAFKFPDGVVHATPELMRATCTKYAGQDYVPSGFTDTVTTPGFLFHGGYQFLELLPRAINDLSAYFNEWSACNWPVGGEWSGYRLLAVSDPTMFKLPGATPGFYVTVATAEWLAVGKSAVLTDRFFELLSVSKPGAAEALRKRGVRSCRCLRWSDGSQFVLKFDFDLIKKPVVSKEEADRFTALSFVGTPEEWGLVVP